MHAKKDERNRIKSRAIANLTTHRKHHRMQSPRFVNNRPEDIVQKALYKVATDGYRISKNVLQLSSYAAPIIQRKPKHYNKQNRWTESFNTKCIASEGNYRYHGYNGQYYSDWLKVRLNRYLISEFKKVKHLCTQGTTFDDYKRSEGWSNFNCAEFIALDVALDHGANPANLVFKTVDKDNKEKKACGQCSMWLTGNKVNQDFISFLS